MGGWQPRLQQASREERSICGLVRDPLEIMQLTFVLTRKARQERAFSLFIHRGIGQSSFFYIAGAVGTPIFWDS